MRDKSLVLYQSEDLGGGTSYNGLPSPARDANCDELEVRLTQELVADKTLVSRRIERHGDGDHFFTALDSHGDFVADFVFAQR